MTDDSAPVDPIVTQPVVVDRRDTGRSATVGFVVPADLRYFRGHFPGMPVVPGVVQIKWVLALAHRYLDVSGSFRGMEALKFQQTMTAGTSGTLELGYEESSRKLRFTFGSGEMRFSSGRLLFGGPA